MQNIAVKKRQFKIYRSRPALNRFFSPKYKIHLFASPLTGRVLSSSSRTQTQQRAERHTRQRFYNTYFSRLPFSSLRPSFLDHRLLRHRLFLDHSFFVTVFFLTTGFFVTVVFLTVGFFVCQLLGNGLCDTTDFT
jgi:hypothetical protein